MTKAFHYRISSFIIIGILVGMTFSIPQYDRNEETIAESTNFYPGHPSNTMENLEFTTYFGGSQNDHCEKIVVDYEGSCVIGGETESDNFRIRNGIDSSFEGGNEGYVTKFNPDGTINFSTYLGGSESEYVIDLAVDKFGSYYIAVLSNSADFPFQETSQNFGWCYVVKLNTDGSLSYCTFLGSELVEITGIAVDDVGACFIIGTYDDSPIDRQGQTDVAVMKLHPDGTLDFVEIVGGNGYDHGQAIALSEGGFVITGWSGLSDLPLKNPLDPMFYSNTPGQFGKMFIAKYNSDRSLNFSTYFGGPFSTRENHIATDPAGNIVLIGKTYSPCIPFFNGMREIVEGSEGFIVKISKTGELINSSYFGGSKLDEINGLQISQEGIYMITGETWSPDFPKLGDPDPYHDLPYTSIFISGINPDCSLNFSRILHANNWDSGRSIGLDHENHFFILGYTHSNNWALENAYMPYRIGDKDLILIKKQLPNMDIDKDGMTDEWEISMGLNSEDPSDAPEDPDSDGLTNWHEYLSNTHPFADDSDGDAMPDGWEIQVGLNPAYPADGEMDMDSDGMPNSWEYITGLNLTDPSDASLDKDGDGLPNLWEYQNGFSPNYDEADRDDDQDQLTNLQEFLIGTDPNNADSDMDGVIDGKDEYPLSFMRPTGLVLILILGSGLAIEATMFVIFKKNGKLAKFLG